MMNALLAAGKIGLGEQVTTVRELAEMTWEEVRDLERARTVAILPVGAVEAHGPHLPLMTDVLIAQAMAREGAFRIGRGGPLTAVVLPPLFYTPAPFGAGFPGTLSITQGTLNALLLDLARGLTRQGFAALAVANAHLDPAHLKALAEARDRARGEGLLPIAFPDLTRKPWAERLTDEFQSGACHAGRYEGSVVLAVRPDLVRDEIRNALPPNPASLSTAIRRGAGTFQEAGGERAYFGWPADASREEGQSTIATLGEILADAVREALDAPRAA
jgi:creatinine amidohydrolase